MSRQVEWNEIGIDVGWGILRGKQCIIGSSSPTLRLLCLHGWLDNANSFDRLVPFLPNGIEIFVLDFPGHGFSDHLPKGAYYHVMTYVINVRAIVLKLKWKSFLFMTHSLGSLVGMYYTALFPAEVKAFINFDFLKTVADINVASVWHSEIDLILETEKKKKIYAVYSEEEAVERLVKSRMFGLKKASVNLDADSARVLLPRATQLVNGGFIWRHDHKVQSRFKMLFSNFNWMFIVKQIRCPVILFQATNGLLSSLDEEANLILNTLRENVQDFRYMLVEGTHHIHLTHPWRIAPVLVEFLTKFMAVGKVKSNL